MRGWFVMGEGIIVDVIRCAYELLSDKCNMVINLIMEMARLGAPAEEINAVVAYYFACMDAKKSLMPLLDVKNIGDILMYSIKYK